MGIELLERAIAAGGRILRVEQRIGPLDPADPDPLRASGYLLTFDVGRVLVAADRERAGLVLRPVDDATAVGGRLVALDDEEPWWRVAGNPITRVQPADPQTATGDVCPGLRIQFREDDQNPRSISIDYDGGAVRVALEEVPGGG